MTIIRTLAAAAIGLGVLGMPPLTDASKSRQMSLFSASSAQADDRHRHSEKHAKRYRKDDRYGYQGQKRKGHGKRYEKRRHAEKRHDRYDYDRYAHRHGRRDYRKPRYYDDRRYYGQRSGLGVFFGAPLTIVIRP